MRDIWSKYSKRDSSEQRHQRASVQKKGFRFKKKGSGSKIGSGSEGFRDRRPRLKIQSHTLNLKPAGEAHEVTDARRKLELARLEAGGGSSSTLHIGAGPQRHPARGAVHVQQQQL